MQEEKSNLLGEIPIQDLGKIKVSEIQLSQKGKRKLFYNLRQTFNKNSMNSMKTSIQEIGLEAPLLVRAIRGNKKKEFDQPDFPEGKKWELIAGERRLRAILKLIEEKAICVDPSTGGKSVAQNVFELVDAKVLYNCSDEWALRLSISENLEREQVSQLDLMIFCIELTEMKDEQGNTRWSSSEVAEIIGKSETWISQTKSLMRLPKEAKELLAANVIDRSIALYFLKIDAAKIPEVIEQVKEAAFSQQELDKTTAEKMYKEAMRRHELAEADLIGAKSGYGNVKNARHDRTMAKQKMKESRKRRDSANEKKPSKITQDLLQEVAVEVGAVQKKTNPISAKTIRQKRDSLLEILKKESNIVINPETNEEFERKDVELVLAVCEHMLGKTGKFEPFEIIKDQNGI